MDPLTVPLAPTEPAGSIAGGAAAPTVSVVIPTRNRAAYLRDALDGLLAGAWQDFEVLVMDQSDGEETRDLVAGLDPRIAYHRLTRRGACPARNAGAALARSELVAFTDDDCVPRPDWLARIVAAFEADPELDFVFGQLKAPPHDGADGWFPETLFSDAAMLRRRPWRIAAIGAGANMSCRKHFLRRVGGFDDILGEHDARVMNADTSMAYKAFRAGRWIASPEIEVEHRHGYRPNAELRRLYASYSFELGANFARFLRRGDLLAGQIFVREQLAVLVPAIVNIARLRRPRRLGSLLPYAHGFVAGLRVSPRRGLVDGPAMRRLEAAARVRA
ncbi:MAG: glycosyltransferase family 2 protein [Dehalococcoidia bacterium]|nr:glycosyltransferase family 2 protein [Dehalococcoidia bacterium]